MCLRHRTERSFHFNQFSLVAHSCLTLCDPMDCSTPGFPVHHQLLELAQTHVHPVGDAIQPSHFLSSASPPAFNLSQHQGLFSESALCIRWPKYWSFSFSISPSNGYPGLISFRTDWLDLLAVQGTLKSFPKSLALRYRECQIKAPVQILAAASLSASGYCGFVLPSAARLWKAHPHLVSLSCWLINTNRQMSSLPQSSLAY